MNIIRTYSRHGNFITSGNTRIEIKTRSNGTRFLFQESPVRGYLSGLKHRPDIGEAFHQIDIIRDGFRFLYLIEITDTRAVLYSIPSPEIHSIPFRRPSGNPKYNNRISGQDLSETTGVRK